MSTDTSSAREHGIRAVSALDDQLRRSMYGFIREAHRPVTREEAAAEVGISRKLAAFHLDKLVAAGLLVAGYEPGRGTRKVGRTPKVYQPTDTQIRVSIPERRPDVLADILLDAVLTATDDEGARHAATRVAGQCGNEVGVRERTRFRAGRLGVERAMTLAEGALRRRGFEPTRENATCVRLRNCPFQPMAARAPELVCGINHAFVSGFLAGADASSVQAVLAPRPGECCVELRAAQA